MATQPLHDRFPREGTSRAPRPRRWIVFFVVLGVLCAVAIVVPIVYNLARQLTPEDVAAARARWEEHGPGDYDLHLLVRINEDTGGTRYLIEVRDGEVRMVSADGEVEYLAPAFAAVAGPAVSHGPPPAYRVEDLFDHMAKVVEADAASGSRNYVVADFDPDDGHPTRFVRRVAGSGDRLEWVIRLDRVEE
jgi:hypothetical protein